MMIKDVGMPLPFAKTIVRKKPSNASQSNAIGIFRTNRQRGAEALSRCAKALEQAGKKNDVDYIHKNHALLLDMYNKVCKTLEKI